MITKFFRLFISFLLFLIFSLLLFWSFPHLFSPLHIPSLFSSEEQRVNVKSAETPTDDDCDEENDDDEEKKGGEKPV